MKKSTKARLSFLRLPALQLVFLSACVPIGLMMPHIFWSQIFVFYCGGLIALVSNAYFLWASFVSQKESYSEGEAQKIVVEAYKATIWKFILMGTMLATFFKLTSDELRTFLMFGFVFSVLIGFYLNTQQGKAENFFNIS